MAEKVVKCGIKREPGFLYYVRGATVCRSPMKRAGMPSQAGKSEQVLDGTGKFTKEAGWMYFVDAAGDISRGRQQVGGKARKKADPEKKVAKPAKAKKAAEPKPTEKAVAKTLEAAGVPKPLTKAELARNGYNEVCRIDYDAGRGVSAGPQQRIQRGPTVAARPRSFDREEIGSTLPTRPGPRSSGHPTGACLERAQLHFGGAGRGPPRPPLGRRSRAGWGELWSCSGRGGCGLG